MASNILSIGQSALAAAQVGISTTGHNFANAATPGYSRQVVVQGASLAQNFGFGFMGQGTEISTGKRIYSEYLGNQMQSAQTSKSGLDSYYTQIRQIDNLLADPASGLSPALQDFFSGILALFASVDVVIMLIRYVSYFAFKNIPRCDKMFFERCRGGLVVVIVVARRSTEAALSGPSRREIERAARPWHARRLPCLGLATTHQFQSERNSHISPRDVSVRRRDITLAAMAHGSFRQQVLRVREDAIVSSVNRLLAEKGFEAMTVDEVAADVGIAKASLYKHFTSKEELAAAAHASSSRPSSSRAARLQSSP